MPAQPSPGRPRDVGRARLRRPAGRTARTSIGFATRPREPSPCAKAIESSRPAPILSNALPIAPGPPAATFAAITRSSPTHAPNPSPSGCAGGSARTRTASTTSAGAPTGSAAGSPRTRANRAKLTGCDRDCHSAASGDWSCRHRRTASSRLARLIGCRPVAASTRRLYRAPSSPI